MFSYDSILWNRMHLMLCSRVSSILLRFCLLETASISFVGIENKTLELDQNDFLRRATQSILFSTQNYVFLGGLHHAADSSVQQGP